MEHEIYVPFSATVVRAALAEPERVARCVPGFQPDGGHGPDAQPGGLDGRLRLRIGGSTITYRTVTAVRSSGEGFAVEAEGTEARGNGTVRLRLTVVPRPVEDGTGTTVAFSGTVDVHGRLAEFEPRQRESVARRLLERFTEALTADLPADRPPEPAGLGSPDDNEPAIPGIPAPGEAEHEAPAGERAADRSAEPAAGDRDAERPEAAGEDGAGADGGPDDAAADPAAAEPSPEGGADPSAPRVFRTEVPPSSLDPETELPEEDEAAYAEAALFPEDDAPEADLARRTMIGRSAEEVDHAPPRGRYAPQPPPGGSSSAREALRWAAPAFALAVAGAVALSRALRRRR